MQEGVFRRRQLPHWDVEGKPFFLTACLAGSLSSAGLRKIRRYRSELDDRRRPNELSHNQWELKKDKLVFKLVDQLLDHQSPVRHLEDQRQAEVVCNALLHFAGTRYTLLAFVVMPSHYHWLFLPLENWISSISEEACRTRTPRERISQSIQSFTAKECNRIRGTSGTYWQGETFDHWVRNDGELARIIQYIEQNPVAAGLVADSADYPWSSASPQYKQTLQATAGPT